MGAGFEQKPWTPTKRRGKIAAEIASPGPACVQLPTLVGTRGSDSKKHSAPAYTFGNLARKNYDSLGPGPAQYNVCGVGAKGKDSAPGITLQSRPRELTKFKTPAPGNYNIVQATNAAKDAAPKYTFGIRPVPFKPSITPGPNVYKIPTVLGTSKEGSIKSAPAFSLSSRHKPKPEPTLYFPGPGTYDGVYQLTKKRLPIYSMGIKHHGPSDEHMKPGPGAHCPERIVTTKRSIPAPSFSIRHSKYSGERKTFLIPEHVERHMLNCRDL